jgi:hypothetical protein
MTEISNNIRAIRAIYIIRVLPVGIPAKID